MHGLTLDERGGRGRRQRFVPGRRAAEGRRAVRQAREGRRGDRAEARSLFRSALDALTVVEDLRKRGVALCICSTSAATFPATACRKLFLTIAAAFAEAERDRIRERVGQVKADQKARGRYLGGKVPFGFRRGESGELVPHEAEQEAIREMVALRAEGRPLRAIADAMRAKGVEISHEGVANVLRGLGGHTGVEELEWRHRNASLRREIEIAMPKASAKARDEIERIASELVHARTTLESLQLVHENLLKRKRVLDAAGR